MKRENSSDVGIRSVLPQEVKKTETRKKVLGSLPKGTGSHQKVAKERLDLNPGCTKRTLERSNKLAAQSRKD